MNYRLEVAKIRAARDVARQRAADQAQSRLAKLVHARDAEIRRLASTGLSLDAIARTVGCNHTAVYEGLHPGKGVERKSRRREYARRHAHRGASQESAP
jgi:hypothetical protein